MRVLFFGEHFDRAESVAIDNYAKHNRDARNGSRRESAVPHAKEDIRSLFFFSRPPVL
jgi:hypothetical protein